jgi:hypothetical protein
MNTKGTRSLASGVMRSALLLLLLFCGTAQAEWRSIGRFDRGEFFIDQRTLQTKGEQREVWSVMNYRNPEMDPQGRIFRSTRSLLQLQCKARKARAIHMSFYTGAMLEGKQISNMGSLPDWEPVPPGTPMHDILDLVCRP